MLQPWDGNVPAESSEAIQNSPSVASVWFAKPDKNEEVGQATLSFGHVVADESGLFISGHQLSGPSGSVPSFTKVQLQVADVPGCPVRGGHYVAVPTRNAVPQSYGNGNPKGAVLNYRDSVYYFAFDAKVPFRGNAIASGQGDWGARAWTALQDVSGRHADCHPAIGHVKTSRYA